jgi:PIN domain nuclease of toxin-antitoxin system
VSGRGGFAEALSPWSGAETDGCLADACALIVFHGFGAAGMSPAVAERMASGNTLIAAVTVWEIMRKAGAGALPMLPVAGDGSFPGFLRDAGYGAVPMDWAIAARAAALPPHHRDPMDRMLIATALTHRLPIITNDAAFAPYGVTTIW